MLSAQQLGKPLILEEFGKNVTLGNGSSNALEASIQSQRAPVFQMIYGLLSSSLSSGGPLRGVAPASLSQVDRGLVAYMRVTH